MKRATAIIIVLVVCLVSLPSVVRVTQPTAYARALIVAEPAVEQVATVPLYRMYSETTGINFYTADSKRRANAIHNGWKTLGKVGYVFDRKMPNTVPLYMAITDQGAGAIFIYTTNFDEVLKLTQKKGWWTEGNGIVCYVASTQLSGTLPLYRLHRPDMGAIGRNDSFYTTSEAERDSAMTQAQYKLIGEEGYVWSTSATLSSTGGSMMDYAVSKGLVKFPDLYIRLVEIRGDKDEIVRWCVGNMGQAAAAESKLTVIAGNESHVVKIKPLGVQELACGDLTFVTPGIKEDNLNLHIDLEDMIKESNEKNNHVKGVKKLV